MKKPLTEKQVAIILVFGLGVMIVLFHTGFCMIIKDVNSQLGLPENCQPDPLLSTMISIAVAVYISLIVLMYSAKDKRIRNQHLKEQIRRNITMLLQGYNIDRVQPANQIDESFISQKNAIALHIHDMVHELGNGINENLRTLISNTAIFALGFHKL